MTRPFCYSKQISRISMPKQLWFSHSWNNRTDFSSSDYDRQVKVSLTVLVRFSPFVCGCGVAAAVWSSAKLLVNPLVEYDDDDDGDSDVSVAGAVLRAVQVMSLMLT